MSTDALVWITRAEPGAAATGARLEALGLAPLVAPLLTVRFIDTPMDLEGVATLALTSINGVRAFVERTERRDFPVFAVGDATAAAARAVGFASVVSANEDGAALVRTIITARPPGLVLVVGPRHPATDVEGELIYAGFTARTVALYESAPSGALPEAARRALLDGKVAAVLVHSARAGEALAALAAPFDLSNVAAVGLSAACLRPLAALALAQAVEARAPREDAMLDAVLAALGKPPGDG